MQSQIETTFQQNFTPTFATEEKFSPTATLQTSHELRTSLLQALRHLAEAVFGFTAVVMLSIYMPVYWLSSHLLFCTFFLIVFATAVRYQRIVAYSAGVLAVAGYCLVLWLHPALHAQVDVAHLFIEPFLLFISSVLTSELLQGQRRHFAKTQEQYEKADKQLQEINANHQKALAVNAELERQIAGQTASVNSIITKVAQLWQQNSNYETIVHLMKHALGADACALYLHSYEKMHLVAGEPGAISTHRASSKLDNPVVRKVLQQGCVCTVRDVLAEEKSAAQELPVMAGPLMNRQGQVVGIVVIDAMPLLKFTPGVVQLFGSLLHMASLSLHMA